MVFCHLAVVAKEQLGTDARSMLTSSVDTSLCCRSWPKTTTNNREERFNVPETQGAAHHMAQHHFTAAAAAP